MSEVSKRAWELFDQLVEQPSGSPWSGPPERRRYDPDVDRLERILGVPVTLGASTQSGLPAKAVDVWLSYELRRAGFGTDEVWPRASAPRVLPREVGLVLQELPVALATLVRKRLSSGRLRGVMSADASVLGKAYRKQVDVVVAQWARGPELLISTKRMDSSLANNAFNRIEESYGDAHNLRGRHPLAAIGYVLVLRSTAVEEAPAAAERLLDLVAKLAQEPEGYDASCVLIMEWGGSTRPRLLADRVAEMLQPGPFLERMIAAVLERTPIDVHVRPREVRSGATLATDEDDGL